MENPYITKTKTWVRQFVIAHQLCPFAKAVWDKSKIRFVLYESNTVDNLAQLLQEELSLMEQSAVDSFETTIIVHPFVLENFYDYLDFVGLGETLLQKMDLEGIIQIASFHPDYQFAGTNPDDAENYTNRSPYPMLHLLREDSVTKAIEHYPNPEAIPQRNINLMNSIGTEQLKKTFNDFKRQD